MARLPCSRGCAIPFLVMYRSSATVAILIVGVALCAPSAAQDVRCVQRALTLNVIDSRRSLIRLNNPAELQGKFRGKQVKILSIKPDERPHRIVILLDGSGSMVDESTKNKWKAAIYAASHLAKANLPNTSLALILFSNSIDEQIDFSSGSSAIAKRVSALEDDPGFLKAHIHAKTAMRDTILAALDLLGKTGSSDVVYAITDGGDNVSKSALREVRDALVRDEVRFFVALLSSDKRGPSPPEQLNGPPEAAELAADSGGLVLGPLGKGSLSGGRYDLTEDERRAIAIALDGLYLAMTNNDVVTIELPRAANKWSSWSLDASPEQKAAHKDWLVVYPRELAPCADSSH